MIRLYKPRKTSENIIVVLKMEILQLIRILTSSDFIVCNYDEYIFEEGVYRIRLSKYNIDLDAKNIITIFRDNKWNVRFIHIYPDGKYYEFLLKFEPLWNHSDIVVLCD